MALNGKKTASPKQHSGNKSHRHLLFAIILEAGECSLVDHVLRENRNGTLSWADKLRLVLGLAVCVLGLERASISHSDLKSNNALVTADGHVKVFILFN
jgi:hypothetical protein